MKKAHRKPARPLREEGMVHVEFDLAPGFVIDLSDNVGRRPRRAYIGLPRHMLRHGLEPIEGKWHRRAKFIAVAAKPCAAFALKSPSAAAAFSTDLRSMAFVI